MVGVSFLRISASEKPFGHYFVNNLIDYLAHELLQNN